MIDFLGMPEGDAVTKRAWITRYCRNPENHARIFKQAIVTGMAGSEIELGLVWTDGGDEIYAPHVATIYSIRLDNMHGISHVMMHELSQGEALALAQTLTQAARTSPAKAEVPVTGVKEVSPENIHAAFSGVGQAIGGMLGTALAAMMDLAPEPEPEPPLWKTYLHSLVAPARDLGEIVAISWRKIRGGYD